MAKRTVVELTDDLDGSEAHETVRFGLDGDDLEIDLSEGHAAEMRELMAPYVAASRRAGGGRASATVRRPAGKPSSSGDVDPKAVRAWAEANGIEVNARGRLKSDVIEQYRAAQG